MTVGRRLPHEIPWLLRAVTFALHWQAGPGPPAPPPAGRPGSDGPAAAAADTSVTKRPGPASCSRLLPACRRACNELRKEKLGRLVPPALPGNSFGPRVTTVVRTSLRVSAGLPGVAARNRKLSLSASWRGIRRLVTSGPTR
eukprot:177293-Hanusia_phi.AAC.1